MEQYFFINQNSLLPTLRMELIDDGRYDYKSNHVLNNALQDATITFSMKNKDTGNYVISRAPATIVFSSDVSCGEKAILQYSWKKRDTREKGTFIGFFEIFFNGDVKEEGYEYPEGNLIVPIEEELIIAIK